MAFITADRVKDTSTTTGTGNITVSGSAPFGYRTFSTVLSVADTFYYAIQGQSTAEWEIGVGTYASTNQFARTTVLASSASGSAVSFSSGTKNVFLTLAAAKTVQIASDGTVTLDTLHLNNSLGAAYGGTGLTAPGAAGNILVSNGSAWTSQIGGGTAIRGTSGYSLIGTGIGSDATFQAFTQSGTGAVARTWQDKASEIVSVFDFIPQTEHAAILDFTSTADLATYINSAITAINVKGGTLYFPKGLYPIASAIGANGLSNIILQGSGGKDLTYAGTKGTVIKFTGTGSGNILTLTDHRGVWVRDIQIVYVSNSFTGTMVNCASSFSTGNGSGFHNVQCYQITNTGRSAAQCFYVKNNVDVVFDSVYCSHANYGWIGLFAGDTGETNMIKLINCTTIALNNYAIINPINGWSLYSVNFEPGLPNNQPVGIYCDPSFTVQNFNMYGCVFADCTTNGTWVYLPWVFSFSMFGGGMFADAGTVTGIQIGAVFASGISIQNVLFSGITTAVKFDAPSGGGTNVGIVALSNNFLSVTTPFSGFANVDAGSIFMGNDPSTTNRFSLIPYTTTQKNAIVTPNVGLTVFDTTLSQASYYTGSAWANVLSGTVASTNGGTGQTSVTTGDLLYGSAADTWGKLADVAVGSVLISGGVGVAPSYSSAPTVTTVTANTNVFVGTSSIIGGASHKIAALASDLTAAYGLGLKNGTNNTGGRFINFVNSSNTAIGFVFQDTSSSVAYSTTSDYRLKENIVFIDNGLTTINALRPVKYDWIQCKSAGEGFIAHELQAIIPLAVYGEKDALNEDNSVKPQGVDYSKIVVHLVAALQELSNKNDMLEVRLAALEAK